MKSWLRQRAFQNEKGVHAQNNDDTIRRPWDASRNSQGEQRNISESLSTAQPSIGVFRNKIGISTVTFKSKINTEAAFPRAVGTDMRLCLCITLGGFQIPF